MRKSTHYPDIYVLGDGQLGRMLRYAGAPLNINVYPLSFQEQPFTLADDCIITAEIERWSPTPLTEQLFAHKNFINKNIFASLADRYSQKKLLDRLKLPTSPWSLVSDGEKWHKLFDQISKKLVVKRRVGGYDGRGQWIIDQNNIELIDNELFHHVIAEQFIDFDFEISLVGARFKNGKMLFYPITHNLQQNGILRYSVTNKQFDHQQIYQQQAEYMLATIMDELDYTGVMAMECFIIGETLLINELAPRVHNSGHWTQLGCHISQFELHLRALLDLPTPNKLESYAPSAMINLIGIEHNPQWLTIPFSQLHWYGKEVREGRKVGHINISHPDIEQLAHSLEQLGAILPNDYQSGLHWTIDKLNKINE